MYHTYDIIQYMEITDLNKNLYKIYCRGIFYRSFKICLTLRSPLKK